MKSLEENFQRLEKLNTVAFGVGVDSSPSNKEWAKTMGLSNTGLLADFWPHGEVARLYGVFMEKEGHSERANIIVDENGVVIFAKLYHLDELPDIEEVIAFLAG